MHAPTGTSQRRSQRGQMLVLFALILPVLLGMLGLSLDLGFNFVQQRATQNAADAAVTVALNALKNGSSATNATVATALTLNKWPIGMSTSSAWTCTLLDNADASLGSCAVTPIPSSASGVKITLSQTYPTFFMAALNIASSTVSASSAGHIESATTFDAGTAPFLVCGDNTWLGDSHANPTGSMWILKTDGGSPPHEYLPATVNPSAIGQTFIIHDSHVQDCGMGSSFKGLNGSTGPFTLPQWMTGTNGVHAGPTRVNVRNGCNGTLNNCVLILPIAEGPTSRADGKTSCTGTQSGMNACAVLWLPFMIYQVHPNTHAGTLLDPALYPILSNGQLTWTVGSGAPGAVTVVLTQ